MFKPKVANRVYLVLILAMTVLLVAHLAPVTSEQIQPQRDLNKVIQDVQKAESSGAQPKELAILINQLNSVVTLEDQLQNLGQQDTDKRSQLLSEISNTLTNVDAEAAQIKTAASQRTSINRLILYSSGAAGAILVTLASHCALSIWRRIRAKRVLQMKLIPK